MTRLPRFLGLADRLQKGQQGGHSQRRSNHRKGPRGHVPDVFIGAVDVWAHGMNHGGQTSRLGQIGNNFTAFDTSIIIFVDQKRLNDGQDTMNKRAYQIVQFVQNTINDLDKQVTFLVFQRWTHEEWQNLVKERTRTKGSRPVCNLTHGRLALRRCPALDLEQQSHDLAFLLLGPGKLIFVRFFHETAKKLHIFGFNVGQGTFGSGFRPTGRG
mmetsp:Transcript_6141/g.12627  ORF Transcript_6141/g.12627 Transcript_6141/m.12627 type:complete len:213 (+) Transcript_6141:1998-2636(+)